MSTEAKGPEDDGSGNAVLENAPIIFMVVLYGVVVLQNAWLCDDAFVTMRTIDNFVHGFGLRYNLAERVQAFTHPLWLGAVSIVYFLTREAYFTLLGVSAVFSVAAFYLVAVRLAASLWMSLTAAGALILSKSFVEYSTSGLENPLTHLCLGLFILIYLRRHDEGPRQVFLMSLVASLGILNRMDTVLFYLPALAVSTRRVGWRRALRPAALGLSPFLAWEVFSLLYYGSFFPNTAYAKLSTGLPRAELLAQGFYYFVDSLAVDPLTLLVISSTLAILAGHRFGRRGPLALGVGLYLVYVLAIGGDFMTGRFFSAPFYVAVALLSGIRLPKRPAQLTAGTVVLVGLVLAPEPRLTESVHTHGIVDERDHYQEYSGLTVAHRGAWVPNAKPDWSGYERQRPIESVKIRNTAGFRGYIENPSTHVVDTMGLSDPLLSRLPTFRRLDWRIGHFQRKVPEGYLETIESGRNEIKDEDLALYYDQLSAIVKGNVFSWGRLVAIAKMNLGLFDHLVDSSFYGKLYSYEVDLADFSRSHEDGTPWDAPGIVRLPPGNGLLVHLGRVRHDRFVDLGLAAGEVYFVHFYRDGALMTYYESPIRRVTRLRIPETKGRGLRKHIVKVQPSIAGRGYDALVIFPSSAEGRGRHSVGYVRFEP